MSLDRLVDQAVRCVKCGAGIGKCDCWVWCTCGWRAERGKPCNNPATTHCSTKMKHGARARPRRNRKGARMT